MANAEKRACSTCGHARVMQQQTFCCRFPPVVIALPIINQITQQGVIAPRSMFPAVEPEAWCGEYVEGGENRIVS